MAPDNWDWANPVDIVVDEDFRFVFPIRVTPKAAALFEQAARSEGVTTHAVIKQAALARLPHEAHR